MAECHKVFSDVGLLVRASAPSKGKKVGSVKKGDKVQLDGEELAGTGGSSHDLEGFGRGLLGED